MHAITLLLLRVSTGMLLVLWGLVRVRSPETGQHLSEKFYMSLFSGDSLHMIMGWAEIALGTLVILGLFRKYVYVMQSILLGFGLLAIWKYILDPFALYLVESERSILFFPSTTIFFATLIMLAFKEWDTYSLDHKFK